MQREELQREVGVLRRELQGLRQASSCRVHELQLSLSRASIRVSQLQQINERQAREMAALRAKYQELQGFTKERSRALTQKNIRIAQLEEEIVGAVRRKEEEMQGQIEQLLGVARSQEIELTAILGQHHDYISELERLERPFRELEAERTLLREYNLELERQVAEAERSGVVLEEWAVAAGKELGSQNEQANDLLEQVEYMMESAGVV